MLPDEQPSPQQIAIWRSMTGVQRMRIGELITWATFQKMGFYLKDVHPDWTDREVKAEMRRVFDFYDDEARLKSKWLISK